MIFNIRFVVVFIWFFTLWLNAYAQEPDSGFKKVIAGEQYKGSPFFQWQWGKHYRKEWTTPVSVKIVSLDTLEGGLTPYKKGGGVQSKTLRLRNKQDKEFVLRSIDKSFGKALPEMYRGTFIESIINDQVSIAHPYAAITIPELAQAAGIYHTLPEIVYVPKQPALGEFNEEYGDQVYLFEQRPDENWEEADNLGNAPNIISTENLLKKRWENNSNRIDQRTYVRSRLFDMFLGDWGRHEDQWRWAEEEKNGITMYTPIPRDRDQAYTKFDGFLLKLALSAAKLGHLQTFDYQIRDINKFNYPARNLDRQMANEVSRDEWLTTARDLQKRLTDSVIESAVKKLPPEVFPESGTEIIAKLKSRRDHLHEYAEKYYEFLAEEVEIVGSARPEHFVVDVINETQTRVRAFDSSNRQDPFFERLFHAGETEEIRLYGMMADDVFFFNGNVSTPIRVRVIGGDGKDSISLGPSFRLKKRIDVYDSEESRYKEDNRTRYHISDDSAFNSFKYDAFKYDKKGFRISPGLVYIDIGHQSRYEKWRYEQFGYEHNLRAKYQVNRNALNIEYKGIYNQLVGAWNLEYSLGAWVPYVINFYGVGNESTQFTRVRRFHRLRTDEYYANAGLMRNWKDLHYVRVNLAYQTIQVRIDEDRFIYKFVSDTIFPYRLRSHFGGFQARYNYKKTNDPITPTKGFVFNSYAGYMHNFTRPEFSFSRLASDASVYFPLSKRFSFAVRAGGATNIGDSEFYQLNRLGSDENLRGYRKQRFYGKSMVYNNNELRFMFDVRSRIFNGKMGFIGFFDNGRVWYPGEDSDKWHAGYGTGLFIAPFERLLLSGAVGFSNEDFVLSAYFGFFF